MPRRCSSLSSRFRTSITPARSKLAAALGTLGRPFLAYATSFFVIGVIWLNHHPVFKGLEEVDRWSVILNLILLIFVAFLPFPTELIADYGELAPIAMFYGLVQAALGFAFFALWVYVEQRYRIDGEAGKCAARFSPRARSARPIPSSR